VAALPGRIGEVAASAAALDPKNRKIHFELGHPYCNAGELEQASSEFALSKSHSGVRGQNQGSIRGLCSR